MFICHDGDLFGSQQSLLLILRNLPKRKYQCHVSIARPGPLTEVIKKELPHVLITQHKRVQWVKHDERSWLEIIGDVFSVTLGAVPRVLELSRYIKQHQIDIVHTNSMVSLEGALAAKQANVPHVWHVRELFMLPNPKLHLVLNKETTQRYIDMLSARVFCIAGAVQNQFKSLPDFWESRYPVIYNALSDDVLNAPLSEPLVFPKASPVFTVGYIGRLSEGKRFHDLLETLAGIKEIDTTLNFRLLVAGKFVDAPYEKQINNLIEEANLKQEVVMLGYQSDSAAFYKQLDVLVVPSQNEPFGRVLIEAMAYGVPCVGTQSGGIPEIINDESVGYLYPYNENGGDKKALAAMLMSLMKNPAQLVPVAKAAKVMVQQRFTAEQQARLIQHQYDLILSGDLSNP